MSSEHKPVSDVCPNSWETRLAERLKRHGVSEPARVVELWKQHRELALTKTVTDLRTQLTIAQATIAPPAGSSTTYDLNTASDERVVGALSGIHARIADGEVRLLTVATELREAVNRLERNDNELEKTLAVLNSLWKKSA